MALTIKLYTSGNYESVNIAKVGKKRERYGEDDKALIVYHREREVGLLFLTVS